MELTEANWRKSSHSGNNGGACIEIGVRADGVLVRDTKDRGGPVLALSPVAWRKFTDQVKEAGAR
jgi:hypothetical protein